MSLSADAELPDGDRTREELLEEVLDYLRSKMYVDGMPLEWTKIDGSYTVVGRSMTTLEIVVDTADGPFTCWLDEDPDFPPALQLLRASMSAPGAGTWFRLDFHILSTGEFTTQFGYGRPDAWCYSEFGVEEDLEMYPRDRVPQWMRDDLEAVRLLREQDSPAPGGRLRTLWGSLTKLF
ncbi:hypothetical protein ACWDOP_27025 [Nocardia sp. NPDC003693]